MPPLPTRPPKKEMSLAKGCLIAVGIFLLLAVVVSVFLFQGLKGLYSDVVNEISAEMAAGEAILREASPDQIVEVTIPELFAAFADDSSEAPERYAEAILQVEAQVAQSESLSNALPLDLGMDFLLLQAGSNDKQILTCLVSTGSEEVKAVFKNLKAGQTLRVRGKLGERSEEDGSLTLEPCLLVL